MALQNFGDGINGFIIELHDLMWSWKTALASYLVRAETSKSAPRRALIRRGATFPEAYKVSEKVHKNCRIL